MPPVTMGVTGGMATGEPTQAVGAQCSLGRNATCVQFYQLSRNQLQSWIHQLTL